MDDYGVWWICELALCCHWPLFTVRPVYGSVPVYQWKSAVIPFVNVAAAQC